MLTYFVLFKVLFVHLNVLIPVKDSLTCFQTNHFESAKCCVGVTPTEKTVNCFNKKINVE